MGNPQNGRFTMENPTNMDDLGTPILGNPYMRITRVRITGVTKSLRKIFQVNDTEDELSICKLAWGGTFLQAWNVIVYGFSPTNHCFLVTQVEAVASSSKSEAWIGINPWLTVTIASPYSSTIVVSECDTKHLKNKLEMRESYPRLISPVPA